MTAPILENRRHSQAYEGPAVVKQSMTPTTTTTTSKKSKLGAKMQKVMSLRRLVSANKSQPKRKKKIKDNCSGMSARNTDDDGDIQSCSNMTAGTTSTAGASSSSSPRPPAMMRGGGLTRQAPLGKTLLQATPTQKHSVKVMPQTTGPVESVEVQHEEPLPDTGAYSSNHVMVNRERAARGLVLLRRSRYLDALCQSHANDMADDQALSHSVDQLAHLQRTLASQTVGENIQQGVSIRAMHRVSMKQGTYSRFNILRKNYNEMGMATARDKRGELYMVQLFRFNDNHGKE